MRNQKNAESPQTVPSRTVRVLALLLLAVFMAAVLNLSAYTDFAARRRQTPVIIVHGLAGSNLYENPGTPDERQLAVSGLGIGAESLLNYPKIFPTIVRLLTNETSELDFETTLAKLHEAALKTELNCDENGNSKPNIGINNYWTDSLANHPEYFEHSTSGVVKLAKTICMEVGADNVYAFNYDWRLDLVATGRKLGNYIDEIKEQTGHDKVIVVTDSLGGITVACYIDAHRTDNELERVVFINSAFDGVNCASTFEHGIVIPEELADRYLDRLGAALKDGQFELLFFYGASLFGGVMNNLSQHATTAKADPEKEKRLIMEFFRPIIGCVPALWECLPYEDFDNAVAYMTDIGFLDTGSGLYKKLVRYHGVQKRLTENLRYLDAHGVDVAIFANYGFPGLPVTPESYEQTDLLIETSRCSAGATVALYGKQLDGPSGDPKYLSPDKEIDASTCALPDRTWFFKNIRHLGYAPGSDISRFMIRIAVGTLPGTVEDVKAETGYGQFLHVHKDQSFANVEAG